MNPDSPLILALDTTKIDEAKRMILETRESIGIYKIGLEFYLAHGKVGITDLRQSCGDFKLFLDLKLHDIPNTVSKSAHAVAEIEPTILTVHAAGGAAMIKAAVDELPKSKVAAVTILTSLDSTSVSEIGFAGSISDLVVKLAKLSVNNGAAAIVCSPHEVALLRNALPSHTLLITPGVRPADSAANDQSRTMTPLQARQAGADYLVIGRPITASSNPGQSAASILASLTER